MQIYFMYVTVGTIQTFAYVLKTQMHETLQLTTRHFCNFMHRLKISYISVS